MSYFRRYLSFLLIALIAGYAIWTLNRPAINSQERELFHKKIPALIISSSGQNLDKGNLLGVQAYIHGYEYLDKEQFYRSMESYLLAALDKNLLNRNTLVIYPEHIGTPLFLLGEKKTILQKKSLSEAVHFTLLTNPLAFSRQVLLHSQAKPIPELHFLLMYKARQMKTVYVQTFATLARMYQVDILAGSILLPDPVLRDDKLSIGKGNIRNVSLLFDSQGRIHKLFGKKNPSHPEQKLMNVQADTMPDIETTIADKQIAVMISHESLHTNYYKQIDSPTDMVVSPACVWDFHSIHWQDTDIFQKNLAENKLPIPEVEKDAQNIKNWLNFSIPGKLAYTQARYGMQIFMKGKLFDLPFLGYSYTYDRFGKLEVLISDNQPALVNQWL